MVPDPQSPNPVPPAPRPRRGPLAFLFKSALGCTAFAIGGLVVLVLALPSLIAPLVRSKAPEIFAGQFAGTLDVREVELGWFGAQHVSDAVLRDPSGAEVARVSAELPSLWKLVTSGGQRIGRVVVDVDADLVADDAGVTNLERALAKDRPSDPDDDEEDAGGADPARTLDGLELDLEVRSKRLRWQDAETRRIGTPFEIRGLVAKVAARPGAAKTATVRGEIASDVPGTLELDATMKEPMHPGAAWPYGTIDAKGRIANFSSAMVDGLAQLEGNLKELLGPRFDVDFDARGVTAQSGEVAFEFRSERTQAKGAAQFEGGVLSAPGESLVVTLPVPRGFLASYVTPHVPPGAALVFGETSSPWRIRVSDLALPIEMPGTPAAKPGTSGSTKKDAKTPAASAAPGGIGGIAPLLAKLAGVVEVDLPGTIGFENEATRAAKLRASLGEVVLRATARPGEPVSAKLTAAVDTGSRGTLELDLDVADPWTPLAKNELPPVDATLVLQGVSTAAFDALAGRPGLLAEGIGRDLRVELAARDASLTSGTITLSVQAQRLKVALDAAIADGVVRAKPGTLISFEPAAGWLEAQARPSLPEGFELAIAPGPVTVELRKLELPLPVAKDDAAARPAADPYAAFRGRTELGLTARLPGVRASNPEMRAAAMAVAISGLALDINLAREGKLDLELASTLDTGMRGKLGLEASLADAWAFAAASAKDAAAKGAATKGAPTKGGTSVFTLPPVELGLHVEDVSTAGLDALANQHGRLIAVLGPSLALEVLVLGPSSLPAAAKRNPSAQPGDLVFELKSPTMSWRGSLFLDQGVLRTRAPEEIALRLELDPELVARELKDTLPAGARIELAPGKPLALDVRKLAVPLPDFAAGESFDVAKVAAGLGAEIALSLERLSYQDDALRAAKTPLALAELAAVVDVAPKKPLHTTVTARLEAGAGRQGTVDVRASLPELATVLAAPPGAVPPVDASITVKGLPTEVLDVFAGKSGLVSKLLGPGLDLEVKANARAADRAEFDVQLNTATTKLAAAGQLADGALVLSGDRGVDLTVRPPAAWVEEHLSSFLPAGSKLAIEGENAPIELKVRDVRVPLPASPKAAEQALGEAKSVAPEVAAKVAPKAAGPAGQAGSGSKPAAPAGGSAGTKPVDLAPMFERLAATSVRLELGLPALTYTEAAAPAAPVSISKVKAAVALSPKESPRVTVDGSVGSPGSAPGALKLDLQALDPLSRVATAEGRAGFRVRFDVDARRVPVALVDALAKQNGLLVDALGASADLEASSQELSLARGAFVAGFRSDQHHAVRAEGRLVDGAVVIDKQDGGLASVNLGPLVSQRVIGSLVPMLVQVEKPTGDPIVLAADQLHYSLDGDLSKLDAVLRLDLGAIKFDFLPGLGEMLGGAGVKATTIAPIAIPIEKGVARYDKLAIPIGGREFLFSGSFSLVDQTMKLGTSVPLAALGKKVSSELEKVRGLLSPDLAVPIEIRGTWRKPKVSVADGFLEKVLKDAAGNQLEGFLKGFGGKKD